MNPIERLIKSKLQGGSSDVMSPDVKRVLRRWRRRLIVAGVVGALGTVSLTGGLIWGAWAILQSDFLTAAPVVKPDLAIENVPAQIDSRIRSQVNAIATGDSMISRVAQTAKLTASAYAAQALSSADVAELKNRVACVEFLGGPRASSLLSFLEAHATAMGPTVEAVRPQLHAAPRAEHCVGWFLGG